MEQKAFSFDVVTLKKILKGFLITAGAAGLTYLLDYVSTVDFGVYTPLVMTLCAAGINAIREYVRGSKAPKEGM